nr:MAG: hypothetical protein [Microvirus sp.]
MSIIAIAATLNRSDPGLRSLRKFANAKPDSSGDAKRRKRPDTVEEYTTGSPSPHRATGTPGVTSDATSAPEGKPRHAGGRPGSAGASDRKRRAPPEPKKSQQSNHLDNTLLTDTGLIINPLQLNLFNNY